MENKCSYMQTLNSNLFDPITGNITKIDLNDIIHSLSNLCRFTGHTRKFYSVAEHSVLVFKIARGLWPDDLEVQWAALLHDAAEAYIGDIASPLKAQLPTIKKLEETIERQLSGHFMITRNDEVKAKVKTADIQAFATEATLLFNTDQTEIWKIEDLKKHPLLISKDFPMRPERAANYFRFYFWDLLTKLNKEEPDILTEFYEKK